MTLTNTEQHHLTIIARGNGNPVFHADFQPNIIRTLLNRKLIKQTPNGTYCITLLGLITHRNTTK
jgi:uncharacterized protein YjhX (UPF0386 family)